MAPQPFSIKKALMDPKGMFGTPENAVSDPRLDRSTKLEILRRWRDDAKALATAENEGMQGDEPSQLQRVQHAIGRLESNKKT